MASQDKNDSTSVSRGMSRRTLVKGMAWSVPAIAVSSAVPAYAVTGPPPTLTILNACKQPGNSCFKDFGFLKGYTFVVQVDNPDPDEDVYIYTSNRTTDPTYGAYFEVTSSVPFTYASAALFLPGPPPSIGAILQSEVLVPAGGTVYFIINAGTNSNSANTDAVGSLYLAWGHTMTAGADPDHPYVPAPPPVPPPPLGEGWIGAPFNFPSTPPCKDCLPPIPTPL